MTDRDVTTVEIRTETWQDINGRKRPGDSMDDVIQRVLRQADRVDELEQQVARLADEPADQDVTSVDAGEQGRLDDVPAHPAETRPQRDAGRETRDEPDVGQDDGQDVDERVRDAVDALDVPGRDDVEAARRESLVDAVAYIRVHGSASRSDLQDEVYPNVRSRVGYADKDSWWKNVAQDGLGDLADEVPELRAATSHEPWEWRG